eukprot:231954-Amphidinium_carterae.2
MLIRAEAAVCSIGGGCRRMWNASHPQQRRSTTGLLPPSRSATLLQQQMLTVAKCLAACHLKFHAGK